VGPVEKSACQSVVMIVEEEQQTNVFTDDSLGGFGYEQQASTSRVSVGVRGYQPGLN